MLLRFHLQLDANRATLLLANQLDEEEEGDEGANARKAVGAERLHFFLAFTSGVHALCSANS